MKITIGSRGSNLALTQTHWIIQQLEARNPGLACDIKIIKTKGDLIQDVSLEKIGDKGLFVKEIEEQLLAGTIDLAVHSMKDMPSELPEGLIFGATPKREDPRDVLILAPGYSSLAELPPGAVIGTGSKRRKFQLLQLRPDLNIVPIRGNIETRIGKIQSENLDGVILAAAGMIRAGYEDKITQFLGSDQLVPAPAQGALALEMREGDPFMATLLQTIADPQAAIQVAAERAFLEGIGGNCHQPIGAYCQLDGDEIRLTGLFGNKTGSRLFKKTRRAAFKQARELGLQLAGEIVEEMKNER